MEKTYTTTTAVRIRKKTSRKSNRTTENAKNKAFRLIVSRRDIVEAILVTLSFFIGRAVLFGSINPVGIAYISPFFLRGKTFVISCLFMGLGMLTRYNHFYSIKYFMCMAVLCSVQPLLTSTKDLSDAKRSGIISAVLVLSGIVVSITTGGILYLAIMAILEGILTFTFGLIMNRAVGYVNGRSMRFQKTLNYEELISISVLIGAIVAGAADIYISGFSFRYFFCTVFVMLMAYEGGAPLGATAGILLGSLIHVSGYESATYIVALSIAGLSCGGLRDLNKFFSIAGFILGGGIASIYMDYDLSRIEWLVSFVIASGVFLFLPNGILFSIPAAANPAGANAGKQYTGKVKEITTLRLKNYSDAFDKLSKSFGKMANKKTGLSKKDVTNLIDDIAARVCVDCKKSDDCWTLNFYKTYQTVYGMLSVCEKNGKITESDIPEAFSDTCINVPYFSGTVNRYFELYQSGLSWQNKIAESRMLMAVQMNGVSSIVNSLSADLEAELDFDEETEQAILNELAKNKIEVESVIVLQNRRGMFEVSVTRKPCYDKRQCDNLIVPIVSRIVGRKMKREDVLEKCTIFNECGKNICKLKIIEEQTYYVTSGVSCCAKSGAGDSGDSHSTMELRNGQCLLALSDGMGSGQRAKDESTAAIELLEEFIESGFDKDTAVKLINSVLLLRGGDESFSTLDICAVDLHSGSAEFVKIGASSTFLLRAGTVEIIRSSSLPAGVLDTVDVDMTRRKLKENDVIVMVTDGILDSAPFEDENSSWIIRVLESLKNKNPQDIADSIIKQAKANYSDAAKDDMTVLVTKIWKKI